MRDLRRTLCCTAVLACATPASAQTLPDSIPAAPRYAAAALVLERFIASEMADKNLPALSIALVDDQRVVWARGFGMANPRDSVRATARTVYRVGSVSKLFTDIGVMQLVERGTLALDTPVVRYLPEFQPAGLGARSITRADSSIADNWMIPALVAGRTDRVAARSTARMCARRSTPCSPNVR